MAMEKQYDVTALGELLIDFTQNGMSSQGNPLFEANPGGAPCNVLAMLGKLGHRTAFIGKVGNDMFGNRLKEMIEQIGIDAKGLKVDDDTRTTLAFVQTFADGDRDFSFYRNPGADMMLTKEEVDEAREQVSYGLKFCDVLKISDNEIQWFTGEEDFTKGIRKLQKEYNILLILLSMGRDGSRAYIQDQMIEVAPFLQENTIETTGAGDTFFGSCLHFILEYGLEGMTGERVKEMLTFANAAASLITTRKGALCVMPTVDEVRELMERNG